MARGILRIVGAVGLLAALLAIGYPVLSSLDVPDPVVIMPSPEPSKPAFFIPRGGPTPVAPAAFPIDEFPVRGAKCRRGGSFIKLACYYVDTTPYLAGFSGAVYDDNSDRRIRGALIRLYVETLDTPLQATSAKNADFSFVNIPVSGPTLACFTIDAPGYQRNVFGYSISRGTWLVNLGIMKSGKHEALSACRFVPRSER